MDRKLKVILSLYLLLLLSACGSFTPVDFGDGSHDDGPLPEVSLYPHAEGWKDISAHGSFVLKNGYANCAGICHGDDFTGGNGPACVDCHKSYPVTHSSSEWHPTGHGRYVLDAGGSTECTSMCHRNDAPEEAKLKTCADCHKSYPSMHDEDEWSSGHKDFVKLHGGVGLADCSICHGTDLKGGSSGVSCVSSSCHHIVEDEDKEWSDADVHSAMAYEGLEKCTACHGTDLKGLLDVKGCDDCHHTKWEETHSKKWAEVTEHGSIAQASKDSCKLCHGADLTGGDAGVTCNNSACHGDVYPHSAAWSDGKEHGIVAKSDLSKCTTCHGDVTSQDCAECHHQNKSGWVSTEHRREAKGDLGSCKTCHGADLKGGESKRSCYTCHDNGGVYAEHDDDWGEAGNHGQFYLADKSQCTTACHGVYLTGGLTGIACNSCHIKYPHDKSWSVMHGGSVLTTVSGKEAFDSAKFDNDCAGCHGETVEMSTAFPPVDSPETSLGIKRCYACHSAYPHIGYEDGAMSGAWKPRHWYYLMYNSLYATLTHDNAAAKIKTLYEGCQGETGCHKPVARRGNIRNYSNSACKVCHSR